MFVYVLLQIEYEDDYKHRYDTGFYQEVIGVYSTLQNAKDKYIDVLGEKIQATVDDLFYNLNEIPAKIRPYFHETIEGTCNHADIISISLNIDLPQQDLELIAKFLFEGQFIDKTFELEIIKKKLD